MRKVFSILMIFGLILGGCGSSKSPEKIGEIFESNNYETLTDDSEKLFSYNMAEITYYENGYLKSFSATVQDDKIVFIEYYESDTDYNGSEIVYILDNDNDDENNDTSDMLKNDVRKMYKAELKKIDISEDDLVDYLNWIYKNIK